MTNQSPVPRGHCGRCDRCGSTRAHCDGHCPDAPRSHCPGCGAPYADTIIAAELTRMARTLTAEDDLPDIGRAKPPGITPDAAASVLGYERARAMGATTNVRIDPVDFQADPTGAIRAARERGSVVLTDDDGKPRMRIGAPLRSDTVPDDVRALLTEAKAALDACVGPEGLHALAVRINNSVHGGGIEIADDLAERSDAIEDRARAAAKAIARLLGEDKEGSAHD